MVRKRIRLAQNFLKDPQLVAELIKRSSIASEDTVVEIGPGEGVITNELAKIAREVIAIEKDPVLARELAKRMRDKTQVGVYTADFLNFRVDAPAYKIFSNIPFNRTADIIKNILDSDRVCEAYLIVQAEAAEKYSGEPVETKISVLSKPWFTFDMAHHFESTDFEPAPAVEVVLLHIHRRAEYLVERNLAELYRNFINFAFHSSKDNLSQGFKKIFTYTQWKRLAKDLGFPIKAKPTELSFEQWLALFRYFMQGVSEDKKRLINPTVGNTRTRGAALR
jgi:16S rRNA A1518/A1519 N6-dimethyltransferase RsmA/KsgA/DIM1 with predicted DNA glycosylase/AP lyase activity